MNTREERKAGRVIVNVSVQVPKANLDEFYEGLFHIKLAAMENVYRIKTMPRKKKKKFKKRLFFEAKEMVHAHLMNHLEVIKELHRGRN